MGARIPFRGKRSSARFVVPSWTAKRKPGQSGLKGLRGHGAQGRGKERVSERSLIGVASVRSLTPSLPMALPPRGHPPACRIEVNPRGEAMNYLC
jgi:hypothetical protein